MSAFDASFDKIAVFDLYPRTIFPVKFEFVLYFKSTIIVLSISFNLIKPSGKSYNLKEKIVINSIVQNTIIDI